jgi:hypothetical protein
VGGEIEASDANRGTPIGRTRRRSEETPWEREPGARTLLGRQRVDIGRARTKVAIVKLVNYTETSWQSDDVRARFDGGPARNEIIKLDRPRCFFGVSRDTSGRTTLNLP